MNLNDYIKVTDRIEPSERCRNEVLNMNKRRKKNIKLSKKGITAIVAVAVAACGGTAAFAAERMGAFEKLKANESRTVENDYGDEFPIVKEERKDYEQIGKAAEILAEPAQTDNENISLAVDSVYCDGKMLVFGITGSLPNGNPEGYGYIHLWNFSLEMNGESSYPKSFSYPDGTLTTADGYMVIDPDETNSFTGSVTCILNNDNQLTEPTDVTIHFNNIECSEKYFTDTTSIGSADVSVTVTPDPSLTKQIGRVFADDGYSFTIHEITPAMMTASCSYPDDYNYNGDINDESTTIFVRDDNGEIIDRYPRYSIMAMVYDEYGNRLDRVLNEPVDVGGGKQAGTFVSPTTDKIIVKFCNKQQDDENGMPVVMKELEIDLKEFDITE